MLPVAEDLPVRVHTADGRITEGEIVIGKVIHGDIVWELYQGQFLLILFPEISPVTVLHGRTVQIATLSQKFRHKILEHAFRCPVSYWLFSGDLCEQRFTFIQDFYHFVPGKLRIGFMPVAVAGQFMAAPVDFLYGIPVGLDHSARHKKGRFDVHGI